MLERNLPKLRSNLRWRLAYLTMWLAGVLATHPILIRALAHPVVASHLLLQHARWSPSFLQETAKATVGWTVLFLVLLMLWTAWQIYDLMGVHLKKTQQRRARIAKPRGSRRR